MVFGDGSQQSDTHARYYAEHRWAPLCCLACMLPDRCARWFRPDIPPHTHHTTMINRRDFLGLSAGVGATLGLSPRLLAALNSVSLPQGQLLQRAIPSTGEMIPVIGLGSSATFATVARAEDASALKAVFQAMADRGARVFDTAPSYGASEQVAGDIVNELGIAQKLFWATKVNVAGRGGAAADPAAARAQIELAKQAANAGPEAELRAAVATDPANLQARFDLAAALLAEGKPQDAVDELLEIFRRDREWNDGAAKTQLFTIFDALKPQDPIVLTGRRRLSSMIFA